MKEGAGVGDFQVGLFDGAVAGTHQPWIGWAVGDLCPRAYHALLFVVVYGPKLSTQRKLRYDHRIRSTTSHWHRQGGCPDFRVIRDRTTCHWAAKSKTQSSWRQFSVQLTTALWIWSYFRTTLTVGCGMNDNHNAS